MESTVAYHDPFELRTHRLQKFLPEPDRKGSEWPAFVDAMQAAGPEGIPAIFITPDKQIMDGGWRWRAAKELEWPEIKCEVQPEDRAGTLVVETLLHRKQMTRGAVVYLALRFQEDFIKSAESRRLSNLRRGTKTREIPLKSPMSGTRHRETEGDETVVALCARWGIPRDTYYRAVEVQNLFSERADLRKELEPQLLSGEKSLWNILSAVGGNDTDQTGRALGVLTNALSSFLKQRELWDKLSAEQRAEMKMKWQAAAAELPGSLRKAIKEVL
jgi:hypothetical protein